MLEHKNLDKVASYGVETE
ncbi:unnamed protein product, partial [Rotaria magnacalcarata]